MRINNRGKKARAKARRTMAGLLSLVLLCGLLPAAAPKAKAEVETEESWAQEYLDALVEWGVMRGDSSGALSPDRNITRAEFIAMVNRAYGYDEPGQTPFTDVESTAWYADDIGISYKAGYFTGTSDKTAGPDLELTREQAVVLLARNMMLEPVAGEVMEFVDGRDFSEWSRNTIQSSVLAGFISGYPDGSFQPQEYISRDEVACMLVKALGTLVSEPGSYNLDNVYGNVTVNTSGVTLRNTTIAGDLYLAGGIGLGDVLLENVRVLGRIVTSGAGESSKGNNSVVFRNVTAEQLVLDSIDNQFVTVRTEGNTSIDKTSVRTPAYLEDVTADGYGLKYIELDGEPGTNLQVAGNIKEVVNLTPNSFLTIAQGVAAKVTMDEKATNSAMSIENGARVDDLNLDVATSVSGRGDIDNLTVNAAGSTVAMLPDTISVRPGLTANVGGEVMDTVAAAESSEDPRLLAGFPDVRNVAPTSAVLVFSANKRGTVYWAVSALADGSVSEEDVISPPTYATNILKAGTLTAAASKTEYTANVTGLTSDGSYYVTAVMVDSRGQHSPVKVTAFTTPDNTVPAFSTGYPVMSQITNHSAQVTVMTNKSCQLYYALMPKGSTAPTAQDFKTGALSGNLGYGTMDAVKNSTLPFMVNSMDLEELATYDLYLWLTDYNGAQSSAVKKLTFTTVDGTAPIVRHMDQTDSKATSVSLTYALNEPGTLYYSVVKQGTEFFRPLTGMSTIPEMTDDAAKSQVEAGMGAVKKGSSTASRADTDVSFTISGLTGETNYIVYYVAKDKAGNYSDSVGMITVNTLDNNAPTVTQEFSKFNGTESGTPLPDSDVSLVFSESIQGVETVNGRPVYTNLMELYERARDTTGDEQALAREELATELRKHITMYEISNGSRGEAAERTQEWDGLEDWVIDYRYAAITLDEDGKMRITFQTTNDTTAQPSALNMRSGATYLFHIAGIADTAIVPNTMGGIDLPQFRTVFAQVNLSENNIANIDVYYADGGFQEGDVRVDLAFDMKPISTSKVPDTEMWDIAIWCDTSVEFRVFQAVRTGNVEGNWVELGSATITAVGGAFNGVSLHSQVMTDFGQASFEPLNELDENCTYEYAIQFTRVGTLTDYDKWGDMLTMKFGVAAGGTGNLMTLSGSMSAQWDRMKGNGSITSIGQAYSTTGSSDELVLERQFTDRSTPEFLPSSPTFEVGSAAVVMNLALNRDGTLYYVVAPKTEYPPSVSGRSINSNNDHVFDEFNDVDPAYLSTFIPANGAEREAYLGYAGYPGGNGVAANLLTSPNYLDIVNPDFDALPNFRSDKQAMKASVTNPITLTELQPNTEYYAYFVLQGSGEVFSSVECYQFTTTAVETPIVTAQNAGTTSVSIQTDQTSAINYALVERNKLPSWIIGSFNGSNTVNLPDVDDSVIPASVLAAMVEIVPRSVDPSAGNRTWFDMYATEYLKSQVRDYIKGDLQLSTDNNPVGLWNVSSQTANVAVTNSTGTPTEFSRLMDYELEYVVLVTARHIYSREDDISAYGFRAVRSLNRPDEVPPKYTGTAPLGITITKVETLDGQNVTATWGQNMSDPSVLLFSGTVGITFDKEVYQVVNEQVKEVWAADSAYVSSNQSYASAPGGAVSILDVLGGTGAASFKVLGSNKRGATNEFTLQFTGLRAGEYITLFNSGYLCNANGNYTDNLRFTFDPTLRNSDYVEGLLSFFAPGFKVGS